MDQVMKMDGIKLKPLKIIQSQDGSVMHALKQEEASFSQFGEAYFSTVKRGAIKGWKKHTQMISNLIVPAGEIQFTFYDERKDSQTKGKYFRVNLSTENYQRITAEPGLWMAFKGVGKSLNMVLNIASIQHNPSEAINKTIEDFDLDIPL